MGAYEQKLMRLTEDFINTYDLYLEQPEHLQTPADLARFARTHGLTSETGLMQADLDTARDVREQLRTAWNSEQVEEVTGALNPLLADIQISIQVDGDENEGLHLQIELPESAPLVTRLTVNAALGILTAVQEHGLDRLRSCMAEPCRDVFIDTSRNKSRRFCSERCANRHNIAAFRERQRGDED